MAEARFEEAVVMQGPISRIADQVEDEVDDLPAGENSAALLRVLIDGQGLNSGCQRTKTRQ